VRIPEHLTVRLLERDPLLRSLSRKVDLRRCRLKKALSSAHCGMYLLVEEAAHERWAALMSRVWTVAFDSGQLKMCEVSGTGVAERLTYRMKWSATDELFVASCEELPWLEWLDTNRVSALAGILRLARHATEHVPTPGPTGGAIDTSRAAPPLTNDPPEPQWSKPHRSARDRCAGTKARESS
jgi:hypothetical protein